MPTPAPTKAKTADGGGGAAVPILVALFFLAVGGIGYWKREAIRRQWNGGRRPESMRLGNGGDAKGTQLVSMQPSVPATPPPAAAMRPNPIAQKKAAAEAAGGADPAAAAASAGEWAEAVDENGSTYYYNAATGATQWTKP